MATPARLKIGRLGEFDFPAGWYAYVGSAFGSGGLRGRLKHHLSQVKKPHWHIDYLRMAANVHEVWWITSDTVYEHIWSDALRFSPGALTLMSRFGASDCKCLSHLVYFINRPNFTVFETDVMLNQEIVLM